MNGAIGLMLIFSVTLFVAALLSEFAGKTIFSTSALFLIVGIAISSSGLFTLAEEGHVVAVLADMALVSVLFTDGMRANLREVRKAWRLPGYALLVGIPVTVAVIGVLVHFMLGLSWLESLLVGAVLSPTDPVFASMLVGSEKIPMRLRRLLNIESGLNDGMALPIIAILLSLIGTQTSSGLSAVGGVLIGVAVGLGLSWLCVWILRRPVFSVSRLYGPLFSFAVLLMTYSISHELGGNEFLSVFFAGAMLATRSSDLAETFQPFGERIVEILKLASLLALGIMISLKFLSEAPLSLYFCAILILFVARPVAIGVALFRSKLTWPETIAAAWFGPRGFASVVFSLQVMKAGVPDSDTIFHLAAITIGVSILLHSSSDVPITDWLGLKMKQYRERTPASRS